MRPPGVVLVSGAGGFVGSHVASALTAAGWRVRGLIRRSQPPRGVEAIRIADMNDRAALEEALRGVVGVVHAAGLAHAPGASEAAFREANVASTEALVEAATAAGVRRVVLISSVAAVTGRGVGLVDGAAPPRPDGPYGRSKLEAEGLVTSLDAARGTEGVVIRPPMVYGPGMRGNPERLVRWVRSGLPLPLGAVRNRRSVLGVRNLAEAVLSILRTDGLGGREFFATDGEPWSTPDMIRGLARGLGREARLLPVPVALLRSLGRLGSAFPGFLPINQEMVESLVSDLVLDDSKLRAATGYRPVADTAEGLFEAGEWYRGEGAPRTRTGVRR